MIKNGFDIYSTAVRSVRERNGGYVVRFSAGDHPEAPADHAMRQDPAYQPVLEMISHGKTAREISRELNKSEKYIEDMRRQQFSIFHANSGAHLVLLGFVHGYLVPDEPKEAPPKLDSQLEAVTLGCVALGLTAVEISRASSLPYPEISGTGARLRNKFVAHRRELLVRRAIEHGVI